MVRQYAKCLFSETKSRRLDCTKEELKHRLKRMYSDTNRTKVLPEIFGLKKLPGLRILFDMSDIGQLMSSLEKQE